MQVTLERKEQLHLLRGLDLLQFQLLAAARVNHMLLALEQRVGLAVQAAVAAADQLLVELVGQQHQDKEVVVVRVEL